jgi:hypothetical protein
MSNTRKIQPKTIWSPAGEKNATLFALTNFSNYHFDNGSGLVDYKLIGMEGNPESAVDYYLGQLEIPSNIVQQWGSSDDIIFNYVAQQLGLVFEI